MLICAAILAGVSEHLGVAHSKRCAIDPLRPSSLGHFCDVLTEGDPRKVRDESANFSPMRLCAALCACAVNISASALKLLLCTARQKRCTVTADSNFISADRGCLDSSTCSGSCHITWGCRGTVLDRTHSQLLLRLRPGFRPLFRSIFDKGGGQACRGPRCENHGLQGTWKELELVFHYFAQNGLIHRPFCPHILAAVD